MVLKTLDYSDTKDVLKIQSWLVLSWQDQHLTWEKKDYEGINLIHISSSELWLPDLTLYNTGLGSDTSSDFNTKCLLYNNGRIVCVPPTTHSGLCVPDLTRWPFDTQNCTLRFGAWVYAGEQVDFQTKGPKAISLADYVENKEWKLLAINVTKHNGKFNCCPDETFPSLRYNFIIKRTSITFTSTYITPFTAMMILALSTVWLDPVSVDRVFLASMNLLFHFTFMLQLSWYVPHNGVNCPLIVSFIRDSMIITALELFLTIAVRLMVLSTISPPLWICNVTNFILATRPGQFLLLNDLDPKSAAVDGDGVDDGASLVISKHNVAQSKEWKLFAVLIDRLFFAAILITYVVIMLMIVGL